MAWTETARFAAAGVVRGLREARPAEPGRVVRWREGVLPELRAAQEPWRWAGPAGPVDFWPAGVGLAPRDRRGTGSTSGSVALWRSASYWPAEGRCYLVSGWNRQALRLGDAAQPGLGGLRRDPGPAGMLAASPARRVGGVGVVASWAAGRRIQGVRGAGAWASGGSRGRGGLLGQRPPLVKLPARSLGDLVSRHFTGGCIQALVLGCGVFLGDLPHGLLLSGGFSGGPFPGAQRPWPPMRDHCANRRRGMSSRQDKTSKPAEAAERTQPSMALQRGERAGCEVSATNGGGD